MRRVRRTYADLDPEKLMSTEQRFKATGRNPPPRPDPFRTSRPFFPMYVTFCIVVPVIVYGWVDAGSSSLYLSTYIYYPPSGAFGDSPITIAVYMYSFPFYFQCRVFGFAQGGCTPQL